MQLLLAAINANCLKRGDILEYTHSIFGEISSAIENESRPG